MLQRIQTVWMILAFLAGIALFFLKESLGSDTLDMVFALLIGLAVALPFANLFNYKKRPLQILVNRVAIFINALLVGLLVYWLLNLSGGIHFPEKGIELIFPVLAVICLILANIFIGRDEKLVKSVDRLR